MYTNSFSKSCQHEYLSPRDNVPRKMKICIFIYIPNPHPDFPASEQSKQYSSVFVPPRDEWRVNDRKDFFDFSDSVEDDSSLADISFTEKDILQACAELKSGSAAGADGVPANLLKLCRKELAKPLFILWRSSLDQGCIPSDLLLVLICPVHKGGSRGIPKK